MGTKGIPLAFSARRGVRGAVRPLLNPPSEDLVASRLPAPVVAEAAPVVAEAAPVVVEAEAAPVSEPPLHLLDGTVGALKEALDSGEHDAHLQALLDAEKASRNRKTALDAIESRLK